MLQVEIQHPHGKLERRQLPDNCIIGKGAQNELRLDSWRIGREHARLFKTPSGVLIEDLGAFGGVTVNGERVEAYHYAWDTRAARVAALRKALVAHLLEADAA